MKKNAKKSVTLLLSVILCVNLFSSFALTAFATDTTAGIKKGNFTYAPHTYMDGDLTDIYYYTDDVFSDTAYNYNEHLATMSMILAASSISSQDHDADYSVKSRNLSYLLNEWGFVDFKVNDYYTQRPGEQTMGVGIAHKVIGEGDGAYTLLAIVPRSAGYQKEWAGNFTVGKDGLHQGFTTGRDIILDFAKKYVEDNKSKFKQTVKIWTVGYSRGAGVANLLAAYLDDNSSSLGVEVGKENIFAYTFGTPSNVQYNSEEEKLLLETNYKNIYNRYSDYDIVTYAPFKNWNFTYYGNTLLFDVYNKDKKATMLTFLEKTNKLIYDLYTEENSSADPDNFTPLMLEIGADLSINLVPADPSYGIPDNQRDFLDYRVSFLIDKLVPDRATYVDAGYQYALQRITSFYFGLSAEQGSMFFEGASSNVKLLAPAYYCHFLADFYLDMDAEIEMVLSINDSLLTIEQYISSMSEDESVNTTNWYLYASEFIASEKYVQLKAMLKAATTNIASLLENVEIIKTTIRSFTVGMTAKVLESGVMAIEMDESEQAQLVQTLTSNAVTVPLTDFLVYLLLGTEDQTVSAFDPSNKNIACAITFLTNAGSYMRVHNNEIILSWLRCEDSFYENEDWHVHKLQTRFNNDSHWLECECGHKQNEAAHEFEEWKQAEDGTLVRSCDCGYNSLHTHKLQTKYNQSSHWLECECGYKEAEGEHTLGELTQNEDGALVRSCDCGYNSLHTHKLQTKYNQSSHWPECECGYKEAEGEHTLGELTQNEDGTLVRSCSCGYQSVHTHELLTKYDQNGHRLECECGYKEGEGEHTFGEWKQTEDGTLERSCSCGFSETKKANEPQADDKPSNKNNIIIAVCIAILVIITTAAVVIFIKKRKKI